ncbi:MAG: class II glutamine amidotransferase [Pseudomonadota bacterium]
MGSWAWQPGCGRGSIPPRWPSRGTCGSRASPTSPGSDFLLSDGDLLYAHRLGRELCWLDRRHPKRPRMGWPSTQTRALLESETLTGERALLVASEPLTGHEKPWEVAPEGGLVVFTAGLDVLRA